MLLTGDLQWLSYKVKATGECFCFVNKVQCTLKIIKQKFYLSNKEEDIACTRTKLDKMVMNIWY